MNDAAELDPDTPAAPRTIGGFAAMVEADAWREVIDVLRAKLEATPRWRWFRRLVLRERIAYAEHQLEAVPVFGKMRAPGTSVPGAEVA